MYLIGFDIGGTKVEAMLIYIGNLKLNISVISSFEFQKSTGDIVPGFVLYKKRVATERHHGYEQLIDKMAILTKEICAADEPPAGVCQVAAVPLVAVNT